MPRNPFANAQRHFTVSTPAPVGGLNVRDAINSMPATDAIGLENWIPQQYGVRCRKGYKEWCINLDGQVNTIMQYQPNRQNVSTYRLFAATDSNIYNVTDSTDAPVVSKVLSGTADAGYFSHTSFTNSAGSYLLTCAHLGGYSYYDGTTWTTPTFGGGAGQISGIDPLNLVYVTTWKSRVWFIGKDSTSAWYLGVNSITGVATELPLGPFAEHGGKLAFISSWTIDAGEGIDDLIVFGFENGDILIYKGTDPSSSSTFALVGSYYVGPLVLGRRCTTPLGGDLLILSQFGLQPLSYVTRGGQSVYRTSSTDYLGKIQPLISELVSTFATSSNGWEMVVHPRENLFVILVPTVSTAHEQYAMYTNTNAWTKFTSMPMNTSLIANNQLYFGTTDGRVCLGFEGYLDAVPYGSTQGTGVLGMIQPAYSYFGKPGMNKQFHMVRPTFLSTDRPSVLLQVLVDYQYQPPSGTPIYTLPDGARWDSAIWDSDVWAGALNTYNEWFGAAALGYAGSVFLNTACVGDTFLASIDVMFEPGGEI